MNRQEAIEILSGRYLIAVDTDGKTAKEHTERVNTALDMAIEALTGDMLIGDYAETLSKAETVDLTKGDTLKSEDWVWEEAPTGDLISRQATIKALEKIFVECKLEELTKQACMETVKSIPSAESTGQLDDVIAEYVKKGLYHPSEVVAETATTTDTISRQAAIEELQAHIYVDDITENDEYLDGENFGLKTAIRLLESLPSEHKPGKWVNGAIANHNGTQINCWFCTACKKTAFINSDFCPNCGADMRGDK